MLEIPDGKEKNISRERRGNIRKGDWDTGYMHRGICLYLCIDISDSIIIIIVIVIVL